jgi:hypothetical protein
VPVPLTLVVVSYPSRLDSGFEVAALRMGQGAGEAFVLERCQAPDEVLFLARRWKHRGRSIVRLDLVGHGDGGRFQLGDGLLFASDGTGYGLARRLGPTLAASAELRLLGCRTAEEPLLTRLSGAKLLRDLQRLLGRQRRVLGTTDHLGSRHWGAGGLNAEGERLVRGVKD